MSGEMAKTAKKSGKTLRLTPRENKSVDDSGDVPTQVEEAGGSGTQNQGQGSRDRETSKETETDLSVERAK